jgi:hypothetical protein
MKHDYVFIASVFLSFQTRLLARSTTFSYLLYIGTLIRHEIVIFEISVLVLGSFVQLLNVILTECMKRSAADASSGLIILIAKFSMSRAICCDNKTH